MNYQAKICIFICLWMFVAGDSWNAFGLKTAFIVGCILVEKISGRAPPEPYYGSHIGKFSNYAHGIKGTIYAVDESTLFVKSFGYDGTGPDAYFWGGRTSRPSPDGFIIPFPENHGDMDPPVLQAHNNTDIILRLPMGKRIKDIRWLSVWCRRFTVDFGEVLIPNDIDVPKPRILSELRRLSLGIRSSNISVLDSKTFYIPNFHFDVPGSDAYFWIGNGSAPNIMGIKVSNEVGSTDTLRSYHGEDIEIQLPENITVYDIDWLAVWSIENRQNFGHINIPKNLNVPPALGQTKITPPWWYVSTTKLPLQKNFNCRELLPNKLQLKWLVDNEYVHFELLGQINDGYYMGFGFSGSKNRSQMMDSDVIIAYYDRTSQAFYAEDYFITGIFECSNKRGVCPDKSIGGRDDIVVLSGERRNGVTSIRFKRLLRTNDSIYDKVINIGANSSIIAAVGKVSKHRKPGPHTHDKSGRISEEVYINWIDMNENRCKTVLHTINKNSLPYKNSDFTSTKNIHFTAKIGPASVGYSKSLHEDSKFSPIVWYINDFAAPVITVVRGKSYHFKVEGGDDARNPDRYHPFYITDSSEGGVGSRRNPKKGGQNIYAGVEIDERGHLIPTAVGRYCEWSQNSTGNFLEKKFFPEHSKILELVCDNSKAGFLNWTVPYDTPHTIYYQCFNHLNMGGKINVVNGMNIYHMYSSKMYTLIAIFQLTTFFIMANKCLCNGVL